MKNFQIIILSSFVLLCTVTPGVAQSSGGDYTLTNSVIAAGSGRSDDGGAGEVPTLKIVKMMGNTVTVECIKGDATAMEFQYLKFGTTLWQPLKTASNSPTKLEIPTVLQRTPERFQIRAIKQRRDERIGDWSQPYLVTVG